MQIMPLQSAPLSQFLPNVITITIPISSLSLRHHHPTQPHFEALHHPIQPIPLLLHGKNLASILFDPAITLPQRQRRGGNHRLQIRTEIRRLVFAEQHADAVELGAVAGGHGHFDLDGRERVADGARDAFGEFGADLFGRQEFEGEGDSETRG